MARSFVKLFPSFWSGKTGRELRKAGAHAQLLATYLLSNPHVNYIGVYRLPLNYVAADLALTMPQLEEALAKVVLTGFAAYDLDTEYVYIKNAAQFQVGELKATDKVVKCVQKEFDAIATDCPFKTEFFATYSDMLKLTSATEKKTLTTAFDPMPANKPATAAIQDYSDDLSLTNTSAPSYSQTPAKEAIIAPQPPKEPTLTELHEKALKHVSKYEHDYAREITQNDNVATRLRKILKVRFARNMNATKSMLLVKSTLERVTSEELYIGDEVMSHILDLHIEDGDYDLTDMPRLSAEALQMITEDTLELSKLTIDAI